MTTIFDEAQSYEPPTTKNIAELDRVPRTVLKSLKAIREEKPDLQEFKVKRSGEGLKTVYTVITLD